MTKDNLRSFFENPFDYARFVPFCRDVLGVPQNDIEKALGGAPRIEYDKDEVIAAHLVATTERNGRLTGILVYKLSSKTTLTRPIGLRKLVEPLVKYNFEAVIAAFVSADDWRLSFVENLPTGEASRRSARRYTYVFGLPDEHYRTPIETFLTLQSRNASEKDALVYREAFSVEALGDRFFKEYKAIYEDFVEEIAGKRYLPVKGKSNTFEEKDTRSPSSLFKEVFAEDGKAVRDYVKKMMGRLVFLQFIQKKGWMGVPKGEAWGAHKGERRYLQKRFARYCNDHLAQDPNNFLEEVLEPLFFNALNTDRSAQGDVADENLWLAKECPIRVPFLSGSLFERDALDATVCRFSTQHFRALFDLFDCFNFTIDEADPEDAEIGIAPDMLGRIFENLLEDNKDKGAFYTPYPVVKYMCQEALLAYLEEATRLDSSLLERFVRHHEVEDDRAPILATLKEALEKVRICDPAIGSGAFPMGMLHELVACHKALAREKSKTADERRAAFTQIKRHIIANNIYGVDIEQGAVDIARLRFWLSLVIDEKEPTPLPNLDYKIVRGDSLRAFYDGEAIDLNKGPGTKVLVKSALDRFQAATVAFESATGEERVAARRTANLALLNALEAYYLKESAPTAIQGDLALSLPGEVVQDGFALAASKPVAADASSAHMLANVRALRQRIAQGSTESVPFFDWQVNRSDILGAPRNDNGFPCYEKGFDIIIGNPPYIHLEKNKALGEKYKKNALTYAARGDIYCLFYEKGLSLLRPGGVLCYITSNKWMRAGYGVALRAFFAKYADTRLLLDFAGAKIFDSATVDTNVLLARRVVDGGNVRNPSATRACLAQADKATLLGDLPAYVQAHAHPLSFPKDGSSWAILSPIEQSIKAKIETYGTPLKDWGVEIYRGVLTGLNEAFIIDGKTKDALIAQDPKSAEIIRPILRGKDIKRYGYTFADKWLIATHNGYKGTPKINIEHYPAIKAWLTRFEPKLSKRSDQGNTPYNLRDCAYWSLFSQPKIVWKRIGSIIRFCYCKHGIFSLDSTCIMSGNHLPYLCALLNSKIGHYLLKDSPTTGTGDLLLSVQALLPLPIPRPSLKDESLVESFFASATKEVNLFSHFCSLYHFNDEEILFIAKR